MTTPEELRAISEVGKKTKNAIEAAERKEEERKSRERRMEQIANDVAEAQKQISSLEFSMQRAAEDGRTSVRVRQVYAPAVDALGGIDEMLVKHFKKKGFEVDIETVDGPDIRFEPDYIHYLRISW
jgi:hypothetical protein